MKGYVVCLLSVFLLFASCKKAPLKTSEVIKFENTAILNGFADNINTVTLTITVPKDSDPQTQVVFTTDLGTFVNSNSATITVGINDNYQCIVQLKSSTVGTATVRATAATAYSASTTVNFTAPDADKIFTIAPYIDNITADGVTTMVLTAAITKGLPASAQSVLFSADNGATFSNNTATMTIPADGLGNAIAYLKKSSAGVVHVNMTVLGVTRNITVNFIDANADNIFTIAPFTDNITADGVSTMVLTAAVNKKLPLAAQMVTFTADNGATFSNGNPSIPVTADAAGNAIAYLKKPAEGTVHVTMSSGGVTRNLTVTFIAPNADNIFTIAPFTDNITADGVSTMAITAAVNKKLPLAAQMVTFSADNGATYSNGTPSIAVTADAAGNAVAYLKKPVEGLVHVTLTSGGVVRNLTVNFTAPNADNIFIIAPFTDNVMADGASTMVLVASVNKKLPVAAQTVTFTADNGATFSNSNPSVVATADAAGNAIAYLKKSTEGLVHVTMTSGGATRNLTANFSRSVPDNMLLTNNPAVTSGFGNSLQITISLLKTVGKPALGYLFVYSATDSNGSQIGVFSNGTASDANGISTVNFTTGSSTYKGIVKITVALQQYPGINQTTSVQVN